MDDFQTGAEHSASTLQQAASGGNAKALEPLALSPTGGALGALSGGSGGALVSRQSSLTPGLRYRNLGKSGLRVSNVGLGQFKISR
jgi:hypothetical protein